MKIKVQSILASLLAVALLTCSASAMTFPDVGSNSPYSTAIEYVSTIGIMVGDNQGNFNPDKIVNRAEMATIVCRVLGQTENLSKSNVFTDVPMEHWANANIGKASELGIVGGYGNGKFGPGDPVTFEQAVTMIIRAINKEDSAIALGGYPTGYLMVAEANGLLKGIQAQQGQGLSRGAVAILLYNYYQNNSGTSSNPGEHTHNYIEKTVPGTGGHYEQVQTGTKWVEDYTTVIEYECNNCHWKTTDREAFYTHVGTLGSFFNAHCPGAGYYTTEKKVANGGHEEPVYENKWIEDSPTTIRICEICGQQEP